MEIIMKQRHGKTAVRSEVITTLLLFVQLIWKDTILTGRYGSYLSVDRSQCWELLATQHSVNIPGDFKLHDETCADLVAH
jgi:hypothetical protein